VSGPGASRCCTRKAFNTFLFVNTRWRRIYRKKEVHPKPKKKRRIEAAIEAARGAEVVA
jgi:hypothetical protein